MSTHQPDYQPPQLPENPRDQKTLRRIMKETKMSKKIEKYDDAQRLMLQKYALDWAYGQHNELKVKVQKDYSPGDSTSIKNPQGVKLGTLSMANPSKKAVCTDPHVLIAMADEKGIELEDTLPTEPETVHTLIEFLYEQGRTDLLGVPAVDKDDEKKLAESVLKEWQITGKTPAGWEIKDASKPTFSVRKVTGKEAALAQAAVEHITSGMDDLLQLEGGEANE